MQLYINRNATNDFLKLTFENCFIDTPPDNRDPTGGLVTQDIDIFMKQLDTTAGNRTAIDTHDDDYYEVL